MKTYEKKKKNLWKNYFHDLWKKAYLFVYLFIIFFNHSIFRLAFTTYWWTGSQLQTGLQSLHGSVLQEWIWGQVMARISYLNVSSNQKQQMKPGQQAEIIC